MVVFLPFVFCLVLNVEQFFSCCTCHVILYKLKKAVYGFKKTPCAWNTCGEA